MASASEGYHEPLEKLSPATQDLHRALVSLQEELEAIDWYQQRLEACSDPELKSALGHNMEEEVEHASMLLEWLRRNHPVFRRVLPLFLFKEKPIAELAEVAERAESGEHPAPRPANDLRLTIGSMKGE
jgi:ferritin-like protein